jgi:transcriptional regulator with XRE-family HTH domain
MPDFASNLITLGQALRTMRQQRGLSQAEVAQRAGLPRLKVIHVEAGRPTVAAAAYARVAAALGAQLQALPAQRPTLEEIGQLLGDLDG